MINFYLCIILLRILLCVHVTSSKTRLSIISHELINRPYVY